MAIAGYIPFAQDLRDRLESNITNVTFVEVGGLTIPDSTNDIIGEIDLVPISRSILEIGPNPSMQFNFILNINLRAKRGTASSLESKAREILDEFTVHSLVSVTEGSNIFSAYIVEKDYAPGLRVDKELVIPVNITFGSLQSG